ncbi:MAG: efflux RND transporter periplasmic adaptor subunit [Acidiferrobacteraceae bacterium]
MDEPRPRRIPDIRQVLAGGGATVWKQRPPWLLPAAALAIILVAGVIWYANRNGSDSQYKSAEVSRGDLTVMVTATGTLEPVNQVDVGSELSGTIRSVEADVNDHVKQGQVLARLDTERLKARVHESQSALDAARAKLAESKATLAENQKKYERLKALAEKQLYSQQELETAHAANQTDLSKAVIVSPVDGIVLKRNVEPGQTVAASFQTPVLFTLAEDLSKMELHVDVDEADVGQVKEGQKASFTVDAYPDRHFQAQIVKVHYAPSVEQDVVTCEALLSVDNSDLVLRPGMTATAEIVTRVIHDALLVPNGALRFTPPAPETKSQGSGMRGLLPRPHRRTPAQQQAANAKPGAKKQQVWILRDHKPVPIAVTVGATDGRMTEITGGELQAGMKVLVDVIKTSDK